METWAKLGIGAALFLAALGMTSTPARATAFPGPDDYGYRAVWFQGSDLIDVRAAGHEIALGDDQLSGAIPIGFTFNFYGTDYTQAYVSSNGVLSFSGSSGHLGYSGHSLPVAVHPYPVIAGYWADLYPSRMGWIYHDTRGEAGSLEFIVGFYEVAHFGMSMEGRVTFEIVLHEGTNDIEILYDRTAQGPANSVAGIQDVGGTTGLELRFFDNTLIDVGELTFRHSGYLITATGTLPLCAGRTVTILGMPGPGMLAGTDGDDVILGGGDADVVVAGPGDDVVCGGGGDDSLDGGPGNDLLFGGAGNDTLHGGGGRDRLNGGGGMDVCDAGHGRDRVSGCEMERGAE